MITSRVRNDFKAMNKLERGLPRRINTTLTRTLEFVKADINSSFFSGRPPSPVGSPPAIVTGELRDSAKIVPARGRDGRFTFGKVLRYETDYAHVLETEEYIPSQYKYNRPFLAAAMSRAEKIFDITWEGVIKV
jgi:hypothetical protein